MNSFTPRRRPSPSLPPVEHPGHGGPSSRVMYHNQKVGFHPPKKSTSMNQLSADVVSRIEYDEKEQECMAKDEQIQVRRDFLLSLVVLRHRSVRLDSPSEDSPVGTFVTFERRSRRRFDGEIGTSAWSSDQRSRNDDVDESTALSLENDVMIFLCGASTLPCRFERKKERKKN